MAARGSSQQLQEKINRLKVPDGAPELKGTALQCLKEAFMFFDADGSQRIQTKDLATVLKALNHETTDLEIADMLSELNKARGAPSAPARARYPRAATPPAWR